MEPDSLCCTGADAGGVTKNLEMVKLVLCWSVEYMQVYILLDIISPFLSCSLCEE